MGVPSELRADMSVTDLAFTILKNYGKPMHFKELISEVMRVKGINPENPGRLIAQMHTEINLDSRFNHLGAGEWGLRDWQPKGAKVVKIRPESDTPAPKRGRSRRAVGDEDDFALDGEEDDEELGDESDDAYALDEDGFEDEEELDDDEE